MALSKLVLILFIRSVSGISLSMFYPFGQCIGDTVADHNDDGSTSAIHLSTPFPFFNQSHSSLFVNTNGDLTFENPLGTFTPAPFPYQQNATLIAAYWGDVDTTNGGDILYRQSNDPGLLLQASTEIRSVFPQQAMFNATWMFITTWENVAFYGANEIGKRKRCTFQCILVTDGRHAFVMFMYNKIEWTTGSASSSGGDNSTGLGGTAAQSGFDAGDGKHYYVVPGSRTADIINIPQKSNIGVPGKFIFRVDLASIERATLVNECDGKICQNNGTCEDLDGISTWRCNCVAGFTGLYCETEINECNSTPCQNNGYCVDLLDAYRCHCKEGFAGENCQIDTDECLSNPCLHGATCRNLENHYTCSCQLGYEGINCQSDINECANILCYNNGTCVDETPGWYCACPPGYTGRQCQTDINECQSNPCMHNGTCIDLANSYECVCSNQSYGQYCQNWIDHCSSSPCLHDGICINHWENFECICPDPWFGDVCEYREHHREQNCTDLEYTECTCFTHKLKPKTKRNVLLSGVVGICVGVLMTTSLYCMWALTNSLYKCKSYVSPENLRNLKNTQNDSLAVLTETPTVLHSKRKNIDNRQPEHHNCFLDHSGFDFSKIILNKDGRLPRCRHSKC